MPARTSHELSGRSRQTLLVPPSVTEEGSSRCALNAAGMPALRSRNEAALFHQRFDFWVAAAEVAIGFGRIHRIADREDVFAETLGDLFVVRTAAFDKRSKRVGR